VFVFFSHFFEFGYSFARSTGHSAASNISRQGSVVLAQSMHYECMSFAISVFIIMYFRASLILTGEC
jgi:hypothetical protein